MWPNKNLLEQLGIQIPIVQSPMAGVSDVDMALAVNRAGGLGSLPGAMKSVQQLEQDLERLITQSNTPVNLNFFCHEPKPESASELAHWQGVLQPFYDELSAEVPGQTGPGRMPFGEDQCALVESCRPRIVSFHFGLPATPLLDRVKAAGCVVLGSATTVVEARWLEANGCDVVIAQGSEAGGHRGMFLTQDVATQMGSLSLVPQVVDAVSVPVIAAGGIGDGRGIAAAFALGASAVQIGTAYITCRQSLASPLYVRALKEVDVATALTNVFSGKPARGIVNRVMSELGGMTTDAPSFPHAGAAIAPLRKLAEAEGRVDFSSHWSGQSAALVPDEDDAEQLTLRLAEDAMRIMKKLGT